MLLWLAEPERLARYAARILSPDEQRVVTESLAMTKTLGSWSISDAALIDELSAILGPVQDREREERSFLEVDEIDDVRLHGVQEVTVGGDRSRSASLQRGYDLTSHDPVERLLNGRIDRPREFAHLLVDEAQDLSPMQWRALGRRGRHGSWTVVGDAAQSSWPDAEESARAREDGFGGQPRRLFHMDTNYRNAREIFAYAERVIRERVPDADIPNAVRETGIEPVERAMPASGGEVRALVAEAVEHLLEQVDGSVAVITPARWHSALEPLATQDGRGQGRVTVIDPMAAKGLEWDATVVVDLDEIVRESPGGVRVLYVALTRAAHRMTVLR